MDKKKKKFNRYTALMIIMFLIFGVILSKLAYLQIYKYADNKDQANTKSKRFISENAPRGVIYDSNGNVLATSVQSYTVTFTTTDESNKAFYDTMGKTFKMLTEHGQQIQDDLKLKLDDKNNFYFDFETSDPDSIKALNIRFKKDRGIDEIIKKQLFPDKQGDLKTEEQNKLDEKIYEYSPEDTFDYLVKTYSVTDILNPSSEEKKQYKNMTGKEQLDILLKKYSLTDIRKYIVVKDAVKMQSFKGYKPITVANIDRDTSFLFYQERSNLPGIDVSMEPVRSYPYNSLASSVIGYIGSINGSEQSKYEEKGYDTSTDKVGKAGIESAFESMLKGTKGGTTVKVNSQGRKTEELFKLDSTPGNNLHLTIDKNIQYSAEQMLQHQLKYYQSNGARYATRAAAVAIEVKTGRILALVNYPGYDPNDMSIPGKLTQELSKKYFSPDLESFGKQFIAKYGLNARVDDLFPKDSNGYRQDKYDIYPKPFYNYATMGLTPPGSTFKALSSVAALEEGVFKPGETILAKEYFDIHPEYFGNNPPRDRNIAGYVDITKALAASSNTFFYEVGIRLYEKYGGNSNKPEALNAIAKWAWRVGLGSDPNGNQKASTGIEIAENFGQVYNFTSFKNRTITASMYNIVDLADKGTLEKSSYHITPMDLAKNDEDDDDLKKAKEDVKNVIKNNLQLVGTRTIKQNQNYNELVSQLKPAIQKLYDKSQKYQENVKKANVNPKDAINLAANTLADYVVYSVTSEIGAVAQIAYASIGQSMDAFTPLQLASYIATVSNGGTRYKAHLVDKITDSKGNTVEEFKPEVLDKLNLNKTTVDTIREGLAKVNGDDAVGTAGVVFDKINKYVKTGGKTGTATFSEKQDQVGRTDFGVYLGVAPLEDPQIAVAVVIYDGVHGFHGAPVARAVFETYFRDELKAKGYTTNYPESVGGNYNYSLNPPLQDNKVSDTQNKAAKN